MQNEALLQIFTQREFGTHFSFDNETTFFYSQNEIESKYNRDLTNGLLCRLDGPDGRCQS